MSEFASVRPSGLIAINLDEGDVLGWAKMTTGHQEIILITENGQALRYKETAVRAMGRQAAGVTAMNLEESDYLVSMDVVDTEADLLVVTANGYGKRTPLTEYSPKGRATMGVATIAQKSLDTTGRIVSARVVRAEDHLTVISSSGQAIRLKVQDVRQASRATMGTRLINLKDGDTVASVARLAAKDIAQPVDEAPTLKGAPENGNGQAKEEPVAEAVVSAAIGENGKAENGQEE
jgi:DNA gyrase subunit A